ncbi:MAG TPA: 3-oxoacyl-ACP reductase [Muricauda sp.]|uniref:SDR family oxidoreductase n=1 Tax=Flagellimonas aurea TaxID=2915619 RepID=A0ABS3G5R4_9FLAO|nr:SDR family oxidoreductase [Allomuricauda aurea]MAO15706.1 3-oxoacyl-ACP reductase [Allomuricauda sp.]UBZ12972.1 SDR family oxidoreductase [Allomuricauda aquimarina]MBC72553.1 3-oxoacyl-ACP reductase [Allomuricauda sp.]MBO0354766.1 SDR family oxidoreductase [Allomuricauda aurea]HBU78480.1 3-oxoacyl-ACP reductase [Allomuricauda sp.]|tara:strand:+ start:835 stop:1575 length:741 start_codon:yes stop_codon:yes gene_type:complete
MDKKIAIVTGGNSGLGYATAKKFCDNGIKTYVIGRTKERTVNACAEIGDNAVPLIFDLTNLDKIPGMIQDIFDKEGQIDILVNNAGINMKKEFIEVTDAEFENILHTNLFSVFSISREVVKKMKETGGGSIVNISSMAAQYGMPKVVAYSASKTAIEGMTRAMAVDLAQYNIRTNCIAPGFIKTKMTAKALDSDPPRKEKVFSRTPMGKMGLPEDIADAVFFMCSKEAKFVTGTVLPVDGGNSIGF